MKMSGTTTASASRLVRCVGTQWRRLVSGTMDGALTTLVMRQGVGPTTSTTAGMTAALWMRLHTPQSQPSCVLTISPSQQLTAVWMTVSNSTPRTSMVPPALVLAKAPLNTPQRTLEALHLAAAMARGGSGRKSSWITCAATPPPPPTSSSVRRCCAACTWTLPARRRSWRGRWSVSWRCLPARGRSRLHPSPVWRVGGSSSRTASC